MRKPSLTHLFICAAIISGCGGQDTVYVWDMKDVIALWLLGITIAGHALWLAYNWTANKIRSWCRKRADRP